MRVKVALLLIAVVALATPVLTAQQRACTAYEPDASISSPSDDFDDAWTGKPAFFQKAIWRITP